MHHLHSSSQCTAIPDLQFAGSCEPEQPHLGAPLRGPELKVEMLSTAVIRLYAHEVADLSRCRILAQAAITLERTREQICSAVKMVTSCRCNVGRRENSNEL